MTAGGNPAGATAVQPRMLRLRRADRLALVFAGACTLATMALPAPASTPAVRAIARRAPTPHREAAARPAPPPPAPVRTDPPAAWVRTGIRIDEGDSDCNLGRDPY